MNEFDLLSAAISTAIKHGNHNQKLHGRRFGPDAGGGAGGGVRLPEDPEELAIYQKAYERLSRKASLAQARRWAADEVLVHRAKKRAAQPYVPSERAKNIVAQFAAMDEKQGDARANEIRFLEDRQKMAMGRYTEAMTAVVRAEMGGDTERAKSLRGRADELMSQFQLFNDQLNIRLSEVHPLLKMRNGDSDLLLFSEQKISDIGEYHNAAKAGAVALTSMVAGKTYNKVELDVQPGIRSVYGGDRVTIGEKNPAAAAHEIAHHIETNSSQILTLTRAYLQQRTAGKPLRKMRDLERESGGNRNYSDDTEVGWDGGFSNAYTGKFYDDGRGGISATEVFSMGVQQMIENPARFAREDPDHFAFMIDVLQDRSLYEV